MRTLTRTIVFMGLIFLGSNMLFGCGMQSSIRLSSLATLGSSSVFDPGYQSYDSKPGRIEPSIRPEIGLKHDFDLTAPTPWKNHGWARTWGTEHEGDSQEYARDVCIDRFGNIYAVGNFANSVEFSCGQDPYDYMLHSFGEADAFLTKFDTSGDFQWARRIGDDGQEHAYGVTCDSEGSVIFTGSFEGEFDFDPHVSHLSTHASKGGADIYVTKYDKLGRHLWTRTWGSYGTMEAGMAVATDADDNVYLTGYFNHIVDFQPGSGVDNHESEGMADIFFLKLDKWGVYQWVRTFRGTSFGIATDNSGGLYIAGSFGSDDIDFSAGTVEGGVHRYHAKRDGFLSKFDTDGQFQWVATFGGSESGDQCFGVDVDPKDGSIYANGVFEATCYFVDGQGNQPGGVRSSKGKRDGLILKYDSDGNLLWNHTVEGPDRDIATEVAAGGDGSVYLTGFFSETTDFAPQNGHDNHTAVDLHDAFLTKYSSNGDYQWTRTWGAGLYDEAFGVAADPMGGAYVAGAYGLTVNFATKGVDNHTSTGARDIFLVSFPPDGLWGLKLKLEAVPRIKLETN